MKAYFTTAISNHIKGTTNQRHTMKAYFTTAISNTLLTKRSGEYGQYFPILLDENSVISNSSKMHSHSAETIVEKII